MLLHSSAPVVKLLPASPKVESKRRKMIIGSLNPSESHSAPLGIRVVLSVLCRIKIYGAYAPYDMELVGNAYVLLDWILVFVCFHRIAVPNATCSS